MDKYVYIITAMSSWLIAQLIKIFFSLKTKTWRWENLLVSGGMPSSHTTFVSSLVAVVAIREGIDSAIFGLSLTLLAVVVYDSVGVRHATGENTKMLQQIARELKLGHSRRAIHMAFGHTPYQVLGGLLLGGIWGTTVHFIV